MFPAMLDIYSFIPLICLKVQLLTVNKAPFLFPSYFNFSFFYFVKSFVINSEVSTLIVCELSHI